MAPADPASLSFRFLVIAMHGARMLFVWFERQSDANAVTVMQEWAVEVMA